MINRTTDIDLSNYVENGEWELLSITVKRNVVYYACCVVRLLRSILHVVVVSERSTTDVLRYICPFARLTVEHAPLSTSFSI